MEKSQNVGTKSAFTPKKKKKKKIRGRRRAEMFWNLEEVVGYKRGKK